jgi:hypothetical protein
MKIEKWKEELRIWRMNKKIENEKRKWEKERWIRRLKMKRGIEKIEGRIRRLKNEKINWEKEGRIRTL